MTWKLYERHCASCDIWYWGITTRTSWQRQAEKPLCHHDMLPRKHRPSTRLVGQFDSEHVARDCEARMIRRGVRLYGDRVANVQHAGALA